MKSPNICKFVAKVLVKLVVMAAAKVCFSLRMVGFDGIVQIVTVFVGTSSQVHWF